MSIFCCQDFLLHFFFSQATMSAFRGPPLERLFSIPAEPSVDASDKEVVLVRYEKTSCAVDVRRDETAQCIVLKCRKHLRLSDEEHQLCEVKSDGRKQLASPGYCIWLLYILPTTAITIVDV